MDYNKTMEYIRELNQKKGMVFGLETMESLLDAVGLRRDFKAIHIAGTNGKGSLCNFVAEILMAASLKVGVYTSPAVGEEMEIIRINGRNIAKRHFAKLFTEVALKAEKNKIFPTAFELQTAVAFKYFEEENCDICVIECGLGGKMDATNVISKPLVTAFASIGLDHMHILGDSIFEIAQEKAGIIKAGAIAISQNSCKEALEVLENTCEKHKVKFIVTDTASNVVTGTYKTTFDYGEYKNLTIKQPGLYQVNNACEAIEIIKALKTKGYNVSDENIYSGLLRSRLRFRYETICKNPRIIIDGAHNENAIKSLLGNVKEDFKEKRLIYVCGMFKDKDYSEAMRLLAAMENAKAYITITPPGERGLKSSELAKTIKTYDKKSPVYDLANVEDAVQYILQNTTKDDIILTFGSLSYLKEFKIRVLKNR